MQVSFSNKKFNNVLVITVAFETIYVFRLFITLKDLIKYLGIKSTKAILFVYFLIKTKH